MLLKLPNLQCAEPLVRLGRDDAGSRAAAATLQPAQLQGST